MKFSALSVAVVFAFFTQTMAEPFPQGTPPIITCTTTTFYCGGPCQLRCPVGWICCGPIVSEEFGGTCYKDPEDTGICPPTASG